MNVGVGLAVFVIAVKGYLRECREEHLVQSDTARKMRPAPAGMFKVSRSTPLTKGQA